MVDKVPKDITAGTANRGSTVHASDADIVGILSRGHLEEDISRVQSAVHFFSASVAYKEDDLVVNAGSFLRANTDNGPGAFSAPDWDAVQGVQSINADAVAAQTLTGGDGIDVVDSTPDHDIAVDATVARDADNLGFFSATTSAQLAGVISNETGTGLLVFGTSPSLVTPNLGTPDSGVLTNMTGLPLTTGVTGTLPVANGGTGVTSSTGTVNTVLSNSPTLVTPALGTPASGIMTNMTGLPVSGLANGTDGELITWDAAGVAATVAVGTVDQVLTSNGIGAAPTFQSAGAQTITNIKLTVDQAITGTGDTDITGLTDTLPTVTGKHAIITFNINYISSQNDKDTVFKVDDGGTITVYTFQLGQGNDVGGITITYIALMAGQVVKAICERDGGLDAPGTITIQGLTATGYESTMQVLELA